MTAIVHGADMLRELDDGERQAWQGYVDRLRDLSGEEYERVEADSWDELQRELPRLTRGEGVLESSFAGYRPVSGEQPTRLNAQLAATRDGRR